MSNVSVTNTFIAGTTAVASQVNTNFQTLLIILIIEIQAYRNGINLMCLGILLSTDI